MSKRVKATPYQCPVADDLFAAGQELERLYPRIYCDVSRRISMTMTSPQLVRRALTTVLEATFRTGVTWAKVVSMVAIAAAFAEECVVQGHPNFVEDIVMCVGHFVAMNLTDWLAAQGGWVSGRGWGRCDLRSLCAIRQTFAIHPPVCLGEEDVGNREEYWLPVQLFYFLHPMTSERSPNSNQRPSHGRCSYSDQRPSLACASSSRGLRLFFSPPHLVSPPTSSHPTPPPPRLFTSPPAQTPSF
ncbi:hypothetical protein C0Q70_20859 [Pomacea canaliculata]|uniref:Bcl-2 Bcl-2 homology region 1-3 domain-containing protein n=1 Tax=Pomacea canaliculata TaxID=400727 RepID=A0A2T7NAV3_POMCA|nr:hypothetical protein C0Q70_20859 [Pomacea canaliculata]